MKWIRKSYWLVGFVITIYLLLPGPPLPPADLPQSLKSNEPGDTVQLQRVKAYFTNKTRQDVHNFYQNAFQCSHFLNVCLPFPQYILNHPPEDAKKIWRDTKRSYYLEEFVHPFRESLFVNGFDWQRDVFTPPDKRVKNKIVVGNKVWRAKISLRWWVAPVWARLALFWAGWIMVYLLGKLAWQEALWNYRLTKRTLNG